MSEYDYRFRIVDGYNYTYATPTDWQAWHEAYFGRVRSVLNTDGEWVRLLSSGCITPDSPSRNCSRTCGNATAMFSSHANVWNCMALATVTMETVQGSKRVDPENLETMDKKFDLGGSLEAFDRLRVFTHARQCFWQSCSDSKYGKCTKHLQRFRCEHISPDNIGQFGDVLNRRLCRDADLSIDSDIAGPGVLVAYIIQVNLVIALASLFWLVTYLPGATTRLFKAVKRLCISPGSESKRPPSPLEDQESGPAETPDPKTAGGLIAPVYSALSDLQEAQTAFGLTIGVIFLLAFGQGKLGLANVTSLLSYAINQNMAFGLLIVGTTSIAVLHPCLRRAGKHSRSWLIALVLSWTLLSTAHALRNGGSWADPERFLENLKRHAAVEDCGNNPGPISFCLGSRFQGPDESQKFLATTITLIPAVHVVCGWLVVRDLISLFVRAMSCRVSPHPLNRRQCVLSLIAGSVNLLGLAVLGVGLHDIIKAFGKIKVLSDGQLSWGFGQLVATALWFPVVFKFAKTILSLLLGVLSKGLAKPAGGKLEDDSEGTPSSLSLPQ
jgi:hypothetical protein